MEVPGVRTRIAAPAWGLGVGIWFGVLDGVLASGASLSGGGEPVFAGMLLDGVAGLVLGGLAGLFVRRAVPGLVLAILLAVAGALVGGWQAGQLPGRSDGTTAPVDPREGRLRDRLGVPPEPDGLVIVLPPGVRQADLPAWSAHASSGTAFRELFATGPGRDEGLAGLVTLRLPPRGSGETLATLVGDGGPSALVVAADRSQDGPLTEGFVAVRPVRGPTPFGLPSSAAGLGLLRLWSDAPSPHVDAVLAEAEGWWTQRASGRRWLLVVELPAAEPAVLDGALARLLAAAGQASSGSLLSLVVGTAPVPAPGASPGRDDLKVDGSLAVSGERWGPPIVRLPMSLMDVAATLAESLGGDTPDADIDARHVRLDLLAAFRERAEATYTEAVDAAGVDRRVACLREYPDGEASLAVSALGGARRARAGGYVLVVDGQARHLYDEILDPGWTHDLLAGDEETCQGQTAGARADDLERRAAALWARAAARVPAAE